MVAQTYQWHLQKPVCGALAAFVFFSTVCSYNFHWYLTSFSQEPSTRVSWSLQHKPWHLVFYTIGLAGAMACVYPIRSHWLALTFVAVVTFLYSAPKIPFWRFRFLQRIAVGKTLYLAFVWTHVTTLLPLFIEGVPIHAAVGWFALSRFSLIYSICILFDFRDREADKKEGIRSMITYFNEGGIDLLFYSCMAIYAICCIVLGAFWYAPLRIAILLLPGLLAVAIYRKAKRNFSDYLYLIVLDGLMMLSALLALVFTI